jgi:hypothetical protein
MSPRPRRTVRRRRLAALAALAVIALAGALVAATAGGGRAPEHTDRRPSAQRTRARTSRTSPATAHGEPRSPGPPAPRGRPVDVSVDLRHPGAPIPPDFLGLSFENAALARMAGYADNGEVVQLLRSLGDPSLRFGGVSADARVAFSQGGPLPRWASGEISPAGLRGLASLADESGASVLLTVGLGHYDPAAAAREATAARALLGARLAGIAIGNEPDRFAIEGLRGPGWSFAEYARELSAYRAAIARAAPGVPIAGPDASSGEPVLPWLRAAAALHPDLLTDHYYPLSSCDGSSPTVPELLAPATRATETTMLESLRTIERSARVPLRIDETNDISCKGEPGVSDSFASALWASDYLARALTLGVRGLDVHDLITWPRSYSPLVAAPNGLHANPEWYALLLAARLRGARPVRATVHGTANVSAWAFERPGGAVELVLVDFEPPGAAPLLVRLALESRRTRAHARASARVGSSAGGTILRLTGPSPYATTHVLLGGSEVGATGTWSPHEPLPSVYRQAGTSELALTASSAALVTLAHA